MESIKSHQFWKLYALGRELSIRLAAFACWVDVKSYEESQETLALLKMKVTRARASVSAPGVNRPRA